MDLRSKIRIICALGITILITLSSGGMVNGSIQSQENENNNITEFTMLGATKRISISNEGIEANGTSDLPSMSSDGRYVVFNSSATNLIEGNEQYGLFIYDNEKNEIKLIPMPNESESFTYLDYQISGNGRFVVYNTTEIYIYDQYLETNEIVSLTYLGGSANDYSYDPSVSHDGRYVEFTSHASNLVPGDTNGLDDIFVVDRVTNKIERVSISSDGDQSNGRSEMSMISGDGNCVVFTSEANNLVEGDTNDYWDWFLHNRTTKKTERVSLSYDNKQITGAFNDLPTPISYDGRYVVFNSDDEDVVPGIDNGELHVFLRDNLKKTTLKISIGDGSGGCGGVGLAITGDGRFVIWQTWGNCTIEDNNQTRDIYLRDVVLGKTKLVSLSSTCTAGNDETISGDITSDGNMIVLESYASNLVEGDTNDSADIFMHDRKICEGECNLENLPQYYQGWPSTPNSLPNKPEWYDDTYGNYPNGDTVNTIGRWGCNTTSNGMIIDYYDRCYHATTRTDPGVLNTWLRNNNGYTSSHGVIYGKVIEYAKQLGIGLKISIGGVDTQKLDKHLENNYPAMLKVQTAYGTHFVTATGKIEEENNDTYAINDPIWGETTLEEHYSNVYSSTYYYTGSRSYPDRSHLQISALSPVHIVVTDPMGRKIGYDPRTDTTWNEIPDAGYVIDDIGEPDGGTLPEVKNLLITYPLKGEYMVKVIGYENGDYEINILSIGYPGNTNNENYSGYATNGSFEEMSIQYEPGVLLFLPYIQK